ncbi:MAG TPA: ATP-binding protein [Actinomycetota bacterium]
MSERISLPRPARLLIAAVIVAGTASVAVRFPVMASWDMGLVGSFLGLAAAISVVELFPLSVRHRTEILLLTLSDALWMAGLLLLMSGSDPHPGVLTLAVGVGSVVGQAVRRRNLVKIAFNVGQFCFAVTVAEVVFGAMHPGAVIDPITWLKATVAMAACFFTNAGLTALVIAFVEGKPWPKVVTPSLGPNLLHWAGNMAMGITGAVVWVEARAGLPLLVVPLLLSYSAYRAWLQGMRERDRMTILYEAGRALAGPLDATTFRPFLALVEELLEAQAAELVVVDGDAVTIYDESGAHSLVAGPHPGAGHQPQAYVPVRDGISPQVAVVGGPGDVHAVLAVYRREELTSSERSLLDALGSQIRVRLINQRLFSETVEQRTQLADIIGHTSDGIFVLSTDRVIESWNPAMEHITGSPAAEAVGRTWADMFGQEAHRTYGDAEPEGAGDILLIRPDRTERWIRYSRSPIRDRDGSLKAEVVVARDITAELESDRLKGDFVATVSHELRTPLTPLKGFLATLLAGTGDEDRTSRQEYYRIMQNQVSRLERLITDLLEVSRIEGGSVPVDSRSVEVAALVREQIAEFAQHQPDRTVHLRAPAGPVFVHADPFRVSQVVSNLLSNALKYSQPDTPVELTVAQAGELAIVSVRDEGDGIPVSEQDRVFERFHRVEGHMTRRTGGTGLGLYIARRLVEAMRGRLWVVSSPGNGSTFSFSLPVAVTPPAWEGGSGGVGTRLEGAAPRMAEDPAGR